MKLKLKTLAIALGIVALSFTACKHDEVEKDKVIDTKKVIAETMDVVTQAAFDDLVSQVNELNTACEALKANVTQENLDKARKLWIKARSTWEMTEAFGFGPVGELSDDNEIGEGEDNYPLDIDPNMDTWPVNREQMEEIINSGQPITAEVIERDNETRGFHLLEFILWGYTNEDEVGVKEGKVKLIDERTTIEKLKANPRLLEYLVAGSNDMRNVCNKLTDKWPKFVKMIKAAGDEGNRAYITTKSAIEEFVQGMIDIADEVGAEKIEFPLNGGGPNPGSEDPTVVDHKAHYEKEESPYSNNSKQDFIDNLSSILSLYTCSYNGKNGTHSVADLVNALGKEDVTKKLIEQIKIAQKAIATIPSTFTKAIGYNRDDVAKAQQEVKKVTEILEDEVMPLISNTDKI